MPNQLFRTKKLDDIISESEKGELHLKRSLGVVELTALGIGAIVGTGIFATIGTASAGSETHLGAGPAITISFIVTAIACLFSALCYAEFASMVPISGSAYTYSYSSFGEIMAWIVGWNLLLEYGIGNVAVAVSWSAYFVSLMSGFGINIPEWLAMDYRSVYRLANNPETVEQFNQIIQSAPHISGIPIIVNIPAVLITVFLTILLVIGIKESTTFNSIIVAIKIGILLFFIAVGVFYVKPDNWTPFIPNGWTGVMSGAALIFFAYIGFDAISTTAEETKNPQRDLPLGMLLSLLICTVLYIVVALILTGMIPFTNLNVADPLALALNSIGLHWSAGFVSLGAVISMTAVLLVFQLGQARIFLAMSRDGLIPKSFGNIHTKFKTPHTATIITGIMCAVPSAFLDISEVTELTNIGTLFAFVLVCGGILILRYTEPNRERKFRTPLVPLVPILGMLSCVYLMYSLPQRTWMRFVIWIIVGFAVYFLYSKSHSKLRDKF
jgi:APA family basic amino acid/polyamine antiporter